MTRLGGEALSPEIVDTIIACTDGVPLFVEELTKAILETGEATIPASLHDSLMARLDRIPEVKEVAQMAACIGREFDFSVLAAIADRPHVDLQSSLDKLTDAELIFRRGTPPDATYSFKHALVRDTAYESLLKSGRQRLHADIAVALQEQAPDLGESEPEVLAGHFTAAGLTELGVRHWERAGAKASERSAYVEAISHFERGLKLLESLPKGRERDQVALSLQMGLGDALVWTRGFAAPEVEAAYNRAHELSRQMGESPELFRVLWGLWHFFVVRADFGRAQALSDELGELAGRLGNPSLTSHMHRTAGETFLWQGAFASARDETTKCLVATGLPPPKSIPGVQDPLVMCGSWLALALWHLGYPDQALARVDAALERAKGTALAGNLGAALIFAAWVRLWRREIAAAGDFADTALRFNSQRGDGFHVALSSIMVGSAIAGAGRHREGLEQIRSGLAGYGASGASTCRPGYIALLAAAYGACGKFGAGLTALEEAESRMRRTGERWTEAEIHRLKGELLLSAEAAATDAERSFLRAIEVAREQDARSPELRAATSLARLWAEQARRAEALDLLAPVYEWFTEGFDTADLRDAKALLDELA